MSACQLSAQWQQSFQALIDVLAAEFEALKQNNVEQIMPIIEQKSVLVAQTEQLEKQLLNQLSLADHKQLFDHLSAHCQNTEALKVLTKQAHDDNYRNGMLLQNMIRLNEYGLSILSGQAGQDKIYGAYGQLKSAEAQLTLATA